MSVYKLLRSHELNNNNNNKRTPLDIGYLFYGNSDLLVAVRSIDFRAACPKNCQFYILLVGPYWGMDDCHILLESVTPEVDWIKYLPRVRYHKNYSSESVTLIIFKTIASPRVERKKKKHKTEFFWIKTLDI